MPTRSPRYTLPGFTPEQNAAFTRILQEFERRPRAVYKSFNSTRTVTATTAATSHTIITQKVGLVGGEELLIFGNLDVDIAGDGSNTFGLGTLAVVEPDGTRTFMSDTDNTNAILGNDDASADVRAPTTQFWVLNKDSTPRTESGPWSLELRVFKLGTGVVLVQEHSTLLVVVI